MLEDIERRLQNWGRWKHGAGAGGLGYAKVTFSAEVVDCDRDLESVVPTINVEAEVTDRAIMTLPSEVRATVEVVYVLGGTMAAKARRLACTEATIYSRLQRARRNISHWLIEQTEARERERQRVLALQAAARPKQEF
jgi:DNA-directed RNA polymerase specialized sigma24 family protein